MDWFYWGTIILLWGCIALNIWSICRLILNNQKCKKAIKQFEEAYEKILTKTEE